MFNSARFSEVHRQNSFIRLYGSDFEMRSKGSWPRRGRRSSRPSQSSTTFSSASKDVQSPSVTAPYPCSWSLRYLPSSCTRNFLWTKKQIYRSSILRTPRRPPRTHNSECSVLMKKLEERRNGTCSCAFLVLGSTTGGRVLMGSAKQHFGKVELVCVLNTAWNSSELL
jgi:hypothetical protein